MLIYPFLLGLLGSYLLTPQVKKMAVNLGAVDHPNDRRINVEPIPNLGGIAIYFGFVSTLLILGLSHKFLGVIISSSLIVFLGVLDDLYELSATTKLVGQIIVTLVLVAFGIKIEFISNPLGGIYYLGLLSIPVTVMWLIVVINVINLIDGMDGLAGGVTVISALTLAIFAYQQGQILTVILTLTVIGSTLGFLRYNFNPAQIFMGDTGSMFLGFMLGVISITGVLKTLTFFTILIPVLALGVPIFDTLFAILRRKLGGQPIFQADKGHLHHRLLEVGLNQLQAVVIVYLISIFLGMIAIGISNATVGQAIFLVVTSLVFLLIGSYKFGMLDLNFDVVKNLKYRI